MRSNPRLSLIVFLSFPNLALAQLAVTELTARSDPAGARVRPLESLVIQARAYGEVNQGDGRRLRDHLEALARARQ